MDGPRILSGKELVAKGAKKVDIKLPELGCKDISRNGSWLEQKQIQSALEARKHLIEVERIDKIGSISHAIWRDDLNLAEVTQKVGGHWQYIGHNVGKTLFLLPEETLFLIEINGLLLKHNEVTVSLQKAYTLCLNKISTAQYKVYASLSRLGYRVLRHQDTTLTNESLNKSSHVDEVNDMNNHKSNDTFPKNEIIESFNNKTDCEEIQCKNENITDQTDEKHICNDDIASANNINPIQSDINCYSLNRITDADSTKMEIVERPMGTEINTNNINNVMEKSRSPGIGPNNETQIIGNEIVPVDQGTGQIHDQTDIGNERNINTRNNPVVQENSTVMNVDCNLNGMVALPMDDNDNIVGITSANEAGEMSNISANTSDIIYSVDETGIIRVFGYKCLENKEADAESKDKSTEDLTVKMEIQEPGSDETETVKPYETEINYYKAKMQKLINRKSAQTRNRDGFNTITDFYKRDVVTINVPDEKILPRNIFLYKSVYTLNLDTVRNHNSTNANSGDEMDMASRLSRGTDAPRFGRSDMPRFEPSQHYGNHPRHPQYRPFYRFPTEWTYRQNLYFTHMYRPPMQGYFMHPRFRFPPHPFFRQQYNYNQNETSRRNMKTLHYNTIMNIAARFKSLNGPAPPVDALYRLLTTYNAHYGEHLELTRDYGIVDRRAATSSEVVVLDDDEDKPKRKKQRANEDTQFKSNLDKLKQLALKLKELQMRDAAVSRHRRVFSNAIKTFNITYSADIYLDSNFVIRDRKLVILDSSSESDVVCVKEKGKRRKRRKLRNPYSVLKNRVNSVNEGASTSRENSELQTLDSENARVNVTSTVPDNRVLLECFQKSWLQDGLGRPAICSREDARLDTVLFETDYTTDILKEKPYLDSWLDVKIALLEDVQGRIYLHKEQAEALSHDYLLTESQVRPLVGPDCRDLRSVLRQLAIVPTYKDVAKETTLKIDYDVCNRNVHFKKTSPPKPNFRVICLDESAPFPSSEDVVALKAKYNDDVPAVVAFVGSGSISYLQINAIDLPVFISDSEMT